MKNSSIFVLVLVGFLVALVHTDPTESVTDAVTDAATTAASATQAGDGTTADSGSSDSPTGATNAPGTTDGSVTGVSGETNAPQSTVTAENTAAPPTTAVSCPPLDILLVKDSGSSSTFTVNILPGLSCTYYARSTSFTKSITLNDPVIFAGDGATLKISGDNGVFYDSTSDPLPTLPLKSKSNQVEISILSTTADAAVTLIFSLDEDTCTTNPCQNGGSCQVIQGQETCTCTDCNYGPRCETTINPCATYQLVCTADGGKTCTAGTGCTATCA